MSKQLFHKGSRVIVLACGHSDVRSGATGVIDSTHAGGYGVELQGSWFEAGANPKRVPGARVVWCEPNQLKRE